MSNYVCDFSFEVNEQNLRDLEKFYQELSDDPGLREQFQLIVERQEFLNLVVRLGRSRGYNFTTFELEEAIETSTASEQGEYFCLPIGCWHKPETATVRGA